MGIERRLLIIGNAMLFSAFGCDDTPDDGVEAGIGGDVQMRDAAIDGSPIDQGEGADVGGEPDAMGDRAMADAASDLGADMQTEPDLATGDMQPPDPDLALPDLAPPEPDLAVADLSPPEPDLAPPDMQPPDMQPPDQGVAACADLFGQPCAVNNEGCCTGGDAEAVCWPNETGALSWQPIPGDWFCNCFPDDTGREMVACAVPGFVGIARAGRVHRDAPCLRTLARLLG